MAFTFKSCRNRKGKSEDSDPDDEYESTRRLAFKSGFLTIQDRLRSLSRLDRVEERRIKREPVEEVKQRPQFATLQELFASRSNLQKSPKHLEYHQHKRPKIPVMRLSKEDWNVKCWEDRLSSHRMKYGEDRQARINPSDSTMKPNKPIKPERRVQVFQGRIHDVATKLEKVREGAPQDEKLYNLSLNKRSDTKSSHEWTDLLKSELEKGVHNPKVLKSELTAIRADESSLTSKFRPSPYFSES